MKTNSATDHVKCSLRAHEIETSLNVAYWSAEKDAQYHIERAHKSFGELAALLGYAVSKVEEVTPL